jgi:predicted nucleic acid-binding protein
MSDTVVVDANLALKWVLLEEDSHTAMLLLDKWTDEGRTAIAPALFAYEVTNILYRQAVSGKLTDDESRRGLEKLFALQIRLKFSLYEEVSMQAMEFAQRSTGYVGLGTISLSFIERTNPCTRSIR